MNARYAVAADWAGTEASSKPNPAIIVDLFWAQASPSDGVDHVRAVVEAPANVIVLLILRAASAMTALEAAARLCAHAAQSPSLRGWAVQNLDVLPLSELITATGDIQI
jgi:hypothetical protein